MMNATTYHVLLPVDAIVPMSLHRVVVLLEELAIEESTQVEQLTRSVQTPPSLLHRHHLHMQLGTSTSGPTH